MDHDLASADPELHDAVVKERERASSSIDLVASLNIPPRAVLEAQASILAIRRCEGYPGKRYHGGTGNLDVVENLARDRAKKLFGAEHANVQPHSGVNANMAVYFAVLQPGDRLLSMDLNQGGHLSHGHQATVSGRFYRASFYGVDPSTELIDYDQVREIAHQTSPHMLICGGSSYPRVIDFSKFRQIADEVGAYVLADVSHYAGLIAGGAYPNPVPFCDFVTFTTYKTLRGCPGGTILSRSEHARAIDAAVFPGTQGTMHTDLMAGKAVTFRLAMTTAFKDYSRQVVSNARTMAAKLADRGFRVVSGGTDSHIVLLDLRNRGLTGKQAQELLESIGIVCNKNVVPFDPERPAVTSGVRLGSAGVTTRGFGETEIVEMSELIATILLNPNDLACREGVRARVRALCKAYPLEWDK